MFDIDNLWLTPLLFFFFSFRSRQPFSTYAVYLTTLSPPAIVGDIALVVFLTKGTESWDETSRTYAIRGLYTWMFISKFIKLLGHYIRYPVDFILLPVSILFGYLHGLIKVYAAWTLNVVSFESLCSSLLRGASRIFRNNNSNLKTHMHDSACEFFTGTYADRY